MELERLFALHKRICACQLCDLSAGRTRAVPGAGPSYAKIMIVGEAPGKEEDLTGMPFVGRAGRLLDSALVRAGLERSDIFITSTVKCRPPNNRRPNKAELDACQQYLQSQIEVIHPKLICLMGNTAASAVLGVKGIKTSRGRIMQDIFIITYHPAAVLRNKNLMDEFVSDLRNAREVVEGSISLQLEPNN